MKYGTTLIGSIVGSPEAYKNLRKYESNSSSDLFSKIVVAGAIDSNDIEIFFSLKNESELSITISSSAFFSFLNNMKTKNLFLTNFSRLSKDDIYEINRLSIEINNSGCKYKRFFPDNKIEEMICDSLIDRQVNAKL